MSHLLKPIVQSLLCVSLIAIPGLASAQSPAGSTAGMATVSPLGDLSAYRTIAEDALKMAKTGDLAGAHKRLKELETEWDNHEDSNKKKSYNRWKAIDNQLDLTLGKLEAKKPDQAASVKALDDLVARLR